MANLVMKRGAVALCEIPLRSDRVLLGRSDSCDIVVPGDRVSRTHCILARRSGKWTVVDRSRHGTFVGGERVEKRRSLEEGDLLRIGPFEIQFVGSPKMESRPTLSGLHRPKESTLPPVVVQDTQLAQEQWTLEILDGPAKGTRRTLSARRQTLGAPGSDVVISDSSLLPDHVELRFARGRPLLSPAQGHCFVDSLLVSSTLPLYPSEEFQIGQSRCRVQSEVAVVSSSNPKGFGEMKGTSQAMRQLFGILRAMASHTAPVLLVGESGTGKELAARGLHRESSRSKGPFVALNCGGIADNLFESELFGHEKGAFTDAKERRDGAFQRADGGTLFLDEVGELPLHAQAKLLRALETGEVRRVGGAKPTYPRVRVVAATNRDLEQEVASGRFREDLFFRLAVLGVLLPPLRERMEDLEPLVSDICSQMKGPVHVAPSGMHKLARHPFPGNVRELRNVLTRAFVLGGPTISASTICFSPFAVQRESLQSRRGVLKDTERAILSEAFGRLGGNRSAMARELGIPRTTLHYKLKSYGLIQSEKPGLSAGSFDGFEKGKREHRNIPRPVLPPQKLGFPKKERSK